MIQVLAFINAHPFGVAACTVVLVFVLRLLSRSGYPEFLPFLPAWCDVTTWDKWGWPGRIGQGLVTCLLSGGVVLAAGLDDLVLTDAELVAAGQACIGAFGIWHGLKKLAPGQAAEKATTTLPSAALLILMTCGCAGSFEEARLAGLDSHARAAAPPPTERCVSLDAQHRTWGGVSKISAVLAGGSGLSMIPADDKKLRIGLAAGAAATAALAAGAGYLSESAATSWARECAQ